MTESRSICDELQSWMGRNQRSSVLFESCDDFRWTDVVKTQCGCNREERRLFYVGVLRAKELL